MTSIRRDLTRRVLLRAIPLVLLGSVAVYLAVRAMIHREFDTALRQQALILAAGVERIEGGGVDFDYRPERSESATSGPDLEVLFDLRLADGSMLRQSEGLRGDSIAMPPSAVGSFLIEQVTLADGRRMRGCQFIFEPKRVARSSHPGPVDRPDAPEGPLRLTIAASTAEIDGPLAKLAAAQALIGAVLLAALALVLRRSVRIGLAPVEQLSGLVHAIDPAALPGPIAADDSPRELRPIVERLNGLMGRVEQVLGRERRFASNAAHELRTPIAEIRTMAEVALEADDQARTAALREIVTVAGEMQQTTATLLLLARSQPGRMRMEAAHVDLSAMLEDCCERWTADEADAHPQHPRRSLRTKIEPDLSVESDHAALASVLNNLIDNAFTHSIEGAVIDVAASATDSSILVTVANDCHDIDQADLDCMFEPFWRRRSASIDARHSGLGLALVRALAECLGAQVEARTPAAGRIELRLTIPRTERSETSSPVASDEFSRPVMIR